jgi:UPF0755 protein
LKKLKAFLLVSVLLLACIVCLFVADLYIYADKPANKDTTLKVVNVKPGQNFILFTENLHKIGVINNPLKFKLLARIKKLDKKLKVGEYALSSSMSPNKVLDKIVNSKVLLHRLTIPEGYSIYQIASLLQQEGLGTQEIFLKVATDPAFTRRMNLDAKTFEGYLFPDTYYFPRGITSEKIISTMVKRFWSVIDPKWYKQAEKLGFSIHEIITIASIIEKETGAASERPKISSVFHNRLKKRMRLESDPTVIYGIKNFNGNITKKHLRTKTPYNTYKIRGIPVGPIANPGVDAIRAAIYPEKTDYLYFVSKKDTTHKFSTNFSAHNRAVRKYQLRR